MSGAQNRRLEAARTVAARLEERLAERDKLNADLAARNLELTERLRQVAGALRSFLDALGCRSLEELKAKIEDAVGQRAASGIVLPSREAWERTTRGRP